MISLHSILDPACVVVDLDLCSKEEVIGALVDLLSGSGAVSDRDGLLRDVMAREALAPTGLGMSCAIPHAHSAAVLRTVVAAARLRTAVDFGAPDGTPATLVFLMVGPRDAAGIHLKLLSKFARFLHDDAFRAAAMAAADAASFAELIYARDT
ncbi:MAG: PTS sugar transporter subunit IIA [Spirochaetota bacterium]